MDQQSKSYRTFVLILLTLAYVFNFLDRTIIGNLSPAIKADLGLSDAQLGLLKGIFFAALYSILGIPVAWLADRYSRVKIISISLAVWSAFTALSGFAANYMQLALARFGVGIGEAGGSPPSHSIISDLYPKEQRASALGVYSLGIPFGIMFSFIAAGALIEQLGWRGTFIALGLPGIILALVIALCVKEPERGGSDGQTDITPLDFKSSVKSLLSIPSWWAMCLGVTFVSFGGYALTGWGVDYAVRFKPEYDPQLHPENFQTLMMMLGLANGVAYGLGTYYGAVIAEKWAKRDVRAYAFVPLISLLIGVPCVIASFWVDTIGLYLGLLTIYLIAAGTYLGTSFSVAQTMAPTAARAMSTALFFLIINMIALGMGPTAIGFISQALTPEHGETHALRLALTSLIFPYLLAILSFFIASRTLKGDWARRVDP